MNRVDTLVAGFSRHAAIAALTLLTVSGVAAAQEDYIVLRAFVPNPPPAPYEGPPYRYLVKANDGNLYGHGDHVSYKITPEGSYVTLTRQLPFGGAIQASDGFFYNALGTAIVRFAVDGPLEVLHQVSDYFLDGTFPSPLVEGADGALYGVNRSGGFKPTRIFRMTPTGAITTVYQFAPEDVSEVTLIAAKDGNFYGTTYFGAANTIFRVSLSGQFTTLHTFGGAYPIAPLLETDDGFFGTTPDGNSDGCGTVYRLGHDGRFEVVYRFISILHDGCSPQTQLTAGSDGRLYGTTETGIFSVTPGGALRLLHSSVGIPDWAGSYRYGWGFSKIVQGSDGNFYGNARFHGPGGLGVVFRLNTVRSACLNDLTLLWQRDGDTGRLYDIGAIKTETPAFLGRWLVTRAGIFPLTVGLTPAITPALPYEQSFLLPAIGPVGLLSVLVTSGFDVCADWMSVDTGGPAATAKAGGG
jgi:uncharacterized repeat protein (TIGR03803 family)